MCIKNEIAFKSEGSVGCISGAASVGCGVPSCEFIVVGLNKAFALSFEVGPCHGLILFADEMILFVVNILSAFTVGIVGIVGNDGLGFFFPGGIEGCSGSNALNGIGILLALGKLVAVLVYPCLEYADFICTGNGNLLKGIVDGVAVISFVCGDVLFAVLAADIFGIVGNKHVGNRSLFNVVPNCI